MPRYDNRSEEAQKYRRLYSTARWRRTRLAQLARSPLCRMCELEGRDTFATICDHVDPKSKETEAGFFAGPFTSLCKPHHDSTKQAEERRGYVIGCDVSGRPKDAGHPWNRGAKA
jgi:5-methylcytosine-specific restriction protein A